MITRQGFLKDSIAATAGSVTAVGNTRISSVIDKPRTFVLVHGAWHGGWCWSRVADVLRARGNKVFVPSLTGSGDRTHLFSKEISLQTHVEDILSFVETEELSDFVLVGHSYAGMVISGVADTLRQRVSHYVYLDARLPFDMSKGASFSWSSFDTPEIREARLKSVHEQGKDVHASSTSTQRIRRNQTFGRGLAATTLATYANQNLYRYLHLQKLRKQWTKTHLHCRNQTSLYITRLYP